MDMFDVKLSAFQKGLLTAEDDATFLKMAETDMQFREMLDILDEIDCSNGIDELKGEFNEFVDNYKDFEEYKINIK